MCVIFLLFLNLSNWEWVSFAFTELCVFTCQELDSFSIDFGSVILKILYSFFTSAKIKNIETCEAL